MKTDKKIEYKKDMTDYNALLKDNLTSMMRYYLDGEEKQGIEKSISSKLQALRVMSGKNQKEAAAAIGISVGALSFYETGARVPNIETLYRLCKYYDVSLDWLVGLSGSPKTDRDFSDVDAAANAGLSSETIDRLYDVPGLAGFINHFAAFEDFNNILLLYAQMDKTEDKAKYDHMSRLFSELLRINLCIECGSVRGGKRWGVPSPDELEDLREIVNEYITGQ